MEINIEKLLMYFYIFLTVLSLIAFIKTGNNVELAIGIGCLAVWLTFSNRIQINDLKEMVNNG